jgi:hypothetical protein
MNKLTTKEIPWSVHFAGLYYRINDGIKQLRFSSTGTNIIFENKHYFFRTPSKCHAVIVNANASNLGLGPYVWDGTEYCRQFKGEFPDKFEIMQKDANGYVIKVTPKSMPSNYVFGGKGIFNTAGSYFKWYLVEGKEIYYTFGKMGNGYICRNDELKDNELFKVCRLAQHERREYKLSLLQDELTEFEKYAERYISSIPVEVEPFKMVKIPAESIPDPPMPLRNDSIVITDEKENLKHKLDDSIELEIDEAKTVNKRIKLDNKCIYCMQHEATVVYQCDTFIAKGLLHNDLCETCCKTLQIAHKAKPGVKGIFYCMECKSAVHKLLRFV